MRPSTRTRSEGETLDELMANIREAIQLCLDDAQAGSDCGPPRIQVAGKAAPAEDPERRTPDNGGIPTTAAWVTTSDVRALSCFRVLIRCGSTNSNVPL